MATAAEIIAKVKAGETVRIPSRYVKTFMRECEVHDLTCHVVFTPEPGRVTAIGPPANHRAAMR